jgi:hypothetical protein
MSAELAAAASASPLTESWRWLRRPALWMTIADTSAVLTALSLLWSTSLVGIFALLWLGSAALVVHYPVYFRSLKQPICAATGHAVDASGHVIANPHNQTLHTAIRWGVVGVVLLYLIWLSHLLLFRGAGLVAWIGSVVVVQNMLTSLFNSHIVDFHGGWMYVLGVGVAGAMVLKSRAGSPATTAVKT